MSAETTAADRLTLAVQAANELTGNRWNRLEPPDLVRALRQSDRKQCKQHADELEAAWLDVVDPLPRPTREGSA